MDWLIERFQSAPQQRAFIHEGREMRYGAVVSTIESFRARLKTAGIMPGQNVAVLGDYSPEVFCLLLALALEATIVIPLTRASVVEETVALEVSGCDWYITFDDTGQTFEISPLHQPSHNPLLETFRARGTPGLILFSSGSTGKPKGILHDFAIVAEKFRPPRTPTVAIPFLMIDHFGGINTILGIVASLGTVVTVADRSVTSICNAIARYRVELLPTTPSFLTLLLAAKPQTQFDLSSLKRITYGTEVMPQSTLNRLQKAFPGVALQQTYGLSEVGVLRSQSRDDGTLWVRIGGEGFQTKVVDDILWIKSQYRMVGYLNAPANFDADGWFNTQDKVEVDGDYFKILGRATDLINVAGQKVYPAEVESVILDLDNILDVAVYGEAHNLLGQIVVAKIVTTRPETIASLKKRVRQACLRSLSPFKVPSKVVVTEKALHSSRQKKIRQQ